MDNSCLDFTLARYVGLVKYICVYVVASYTGSSSDEDDVNPRDKQQVSLIVSTT